MRESDQRIIDAIIRKASALCPQSLALIGIYGSVATGDVHEKSDLDLLILINDEHGRVLADAFLLDDVGIGYDLYCTTWEMLEEDAACNHPHLAKLLDSTVVYAPDPQAIVRLERLRRQTTARLASDVRFAKAQTALQSAKSAYADCLLATDWEQIRLHAGAVLYHLTDALMLYHGKYFRKGVKRTFAEMDALDLPFSVEKSVLNVIDAPTIDALHTALTALVRSAVAAMPMPHTKEAPTAQAIRGTYEEMFSNWRNKVWEAAEREDRFSSFMNTASFRFMLEGIAEELAIDVPRVLACFDPQDLRANANAFDDALERYAQVYRQVGVTPKRFANIDAFLAAYESSPLDQIHPQGGTE